MSNMRTHVEDTVTALDMLLEYFDVGWRPTSGVQDAYRYLIIAY
jgi:hypothetical protein